MAEENESSVCKTYFGKKTGRKISNYERIVVLDPAVVINHILKIG